MNSVKRKKNNIKNNIPLLVFGIIIFILIILIFVIYNNNDRTDRVGNIKIHYPRMVNTNTTTRYINTSDNKLIEFSYSNFAWNYTYYGEMVMDNGDIYAFNCSDLQEYNANNCLVRKVDSISNEDFKKIVKYGKNITEKYNTKNEMNDYGEVTISMVKDDIEIVLIAKGDNKITNSSKNISELLKLLKKYDIYV